jgi:large subunit ribosomal protein L28
MSRVCGITGKGVQFGNNVSHSQRKTRRRWNPNLQDVSMWSDVLGQMVGLRLTVNGIRTVEHNGGLDAFLMSAKPAALGDEERTLKKRIEKAAAKKEAKAA